MPTPREQDKLDKAVAKEHERFQRALGRMTMLWADLENNLYIALRHYSGVSDAVARALFSGGRADGMIKFIRAIAHNIKLKETNKNRLDDLEAVFTQINEINAMRDLITHHAGASLIEFDDDDPTTRYLHKHRVSRHENKLKFKVGSGLLEDIGADLLECCLIGVNYLGRSASIILADERRERFRSSVFGFSPFNLHARWSSHGPRRGCPQACPVGR